MSQKKKKISPKCELFVLFCFGIYLSHFSLCFSVTVFPNKWQNLSRPAHTAKPPAVEIVVVVVIVVIAVFVVIVVIVVGFFDFVIIFVCLFCLCVFCLSREMIYFLD